MATVLPYGLHYTLLAASGFVPGVPLLALLTSLQARLECIAGTAVGCRIAATGVMAVALPTVST
ncbi:hypothetical protein [Roseobacter sp.]|uniref:hypothetical protein n=1 Tax=Roseobacter sp. TaxID=1907202 RepID=UPI00385ED3E6